MKVTLIPEGTLMLNAEEHIGRMAAICYDADISADACVRRAIKCKDSGHLATMRFAFATISVEGISRVCSHQLVRMAHAGILQASQRYMESIPDFLEPLTFNRIDGDRREKLCKFTIPEEEWAVSMYAAGYSMQEIGDAMGIGSDGVCRIIKRAGMSDIVRNEMAVSKGIRSDFFDHVDAPEKAYLLGFVAADGSITGNQLTIEQAAENYTGLLVAQKLLKPHGRLLQGKIHSRDDVQDTYRLCVSSEHLAKRLGELGISERKGLTYDPCTAIASMGEHLHPFFWRGMLDGDGSISMQKSNGDCNVTMTGTRFTCEAFKQFAHHIGVSTTASVTQKGNSFAVTIGGRKQVESLLAAVYADGLLGFFPKKYARAASISPSVKPGYLASIQCLANRLGVVVPPAISDTHQMVSDWFRIIDDAQHAYRIARANGMRKEDARYILPQGSNTSINLCLNFQGWQDFLKNRDDKHAQWEIRNVASEIRNLLIGIAPGIFTK